MNTIAEQSKLQQCERRSSISSSSSDSSFSENEHNKTHSHTRVKRSKIDTSSISGSSLKSSKVINSTLTTVGNAKWTKLQTSAVTNVKSLKLCDVKCAHIEGVDSLKRAVIERSVVLDCTKIKRGKIRDSTLRRVVLGRSSLDNCEAADCVIHGSKFTGMVLENGIWKNGSLVGKVDETKEVIFRPLDRTTLGSSAPKLDTEKSYQTPVHAKDKDVPRVDVAKDWEAGFIEPLPRYESRWLMH